MWSSQAPPFSNPTSIFHLLFLDCFRFDTFVRGWRRWLSSTLFQYQCHDVHQVSVLHVGWKMFIDMFVACLSIVQVVRISRLVFSSTGEYPILQALCFGDGRPFVTNAVAFFGCCKVYTGHIWLHGFTSCLQHLGSIQQQVDAKDTELVSCEFGQKWYVPWHKSGGGRSKNKWICPSRQTVLCNGFLHLPFVLPRD